MRRRVRDWLACSIAIFAAGFLLFILSAPPVMKAILEAKIKAGSSCCDLFPPVYKPFTTIIESDFGAPLLWYFNDVWHFGITLIGDDSPSLGSIALYSAGLIVLLTGIAAPFGRKILRRRAKAANTTLGNQNNMRDEPWRARLEQQERRIASR
jgi:hypothetical protein